MEQAATPGATVLAQIQTHQNIAKQSTDLWSQHAPWSATQCAD